MATTQKKTRNNNTTTTSNINSSSNNQKKLYVYNLNNNGVGNRTPDQYHPSIITNSVVSTTAKKILSRSYWGITKRSSKLPTNNNNIFDYRSSSSKSKSNTNCNIIEESEFEKKELAHEEEGKQVRRHQPASNSAAAYHEYDDDTKRRSVSEVESYLISAGSRSKILSSNYSTTTITATSCNNNNNININKDVVISSIVEGGRKSVSHVDNNVAFVGMKMITSLSASSTERTSFKAEQEEANRLQVKVMVADMPAFMQLHAFRCARTTFDSLETFSAKHIAFTLKKDFDKVYGPAWHCIVGSSFGSFVTHSTGCFLYFSLDTKLYILLFRTKVRKTLD